MTVHISLSVRGALDWSPAEWRRNVNIFSDDDGKRVTIPQARDYLMDELSKGHEVIPFSKCDNFDYKTGCRGHNSL